MTHKSVGKDTVNEPMSAYGMLVEIADINRITKARYPRGFASVVGIGEMKWSVVLYDNQINSTSFPASTPEAAFQQARAYLNEHRDLSESELWAALGVEMADAA